jgi:membrane-associated phospholipid phosphatase
MEMKPLFYKFGKNIIDSFRGYNLIFHLLAIAGTYIIVVSGFDWKYFQFFRGSNLSYILFSAAAIGGIAPVLVPIAIIIFGKIHRKFELLNTGYALGQAAILGLLISSFYKMFTGRVHPDLIYQASSFDISGIFQFGLFDGGIFWGWPSSHATIAFAMAFALWTLYSKNKIVKTLALIYAFYIGIGISMTIHWFSDFVAGAIIGTVIGTVVGRAFKTKEMK